MKTVALSDLFESIILGFDPGYGHGKIVLTMPLITAGPFGAQPDTGGDNIAFQGPDGLWYIADPAQTHTRTACVPSVVGAGSTDLGLLADFSVARARKTAVPDRVRFGRGFNYLVGDGVGQWAEEEQRMDFNRLTDSPQLRAVCYTVIDRVLAPQADDAPADRIDLRAWVGAPNGPALRVMVGLPVEVMIDRDAATTTLKAMRRWMIGEHSFEVNDVTTHLVITDVQATAQPIGTFYAWGFDDRGEWVRNINDLRAPVGIADIGMKTLDLFSVSGGRINARYTGGDTAGMARAAQALIDLMAQEYGVEGVSLHEADTLIHSPRPTRWLPGGREVDVSPLVEQALARATAGIVDFLDKKWGRGSDFAYILFTGGGAGTLREALAAKYPFGEVLPDPVMANAVGLARYGQRIWGKK